MEAEYLGMMEQIVIACDDKLNILYNNYHEKFYNRIVKHCGKTLNLNHMRMKTGTTLNRCFSSNKQGNLETEMSTMDKLATMKEVFSFDQKDDDNLSYFRSLGMLEILTIIDEYDKRRHRAMMYKSMKQIDMEEKLHKVTPLQLIVGYSSFRIQGSRFMSFLPSCECSASSARWRRGTKLR